METTVLDYILRLLNDMPIIKQIVDTCVEIQTSKGTRSPAPEGQLSKIQTEIDNVMNAIKQGIITPTTKATLEGLEQDKENLKIAIAKERVERTVLSKRGNVVLDL